MRYYFLSLLLLAFLSCKKSTEEKPPCRITNVSRAGGNLPVTYRGDTLVTWGEGNYGSSMYFTPAGRLQRIEEPVTDPYILTELLYNTNGTV